MGNYDRKKSTSACANGCMQAVKWIPVIFVTAVIGWSYYAYVVELCLITVQNIFERIVFLVFYHIVGVLFIWSYWNTIFTPVGTVPACWRISEQDIDRLFRADNQEQQKRILENCAREFPVSNRTLNGSVRFCEKCKIIKPDRAHHCSVCGVCVLKMDHHCPWVNNCVNFTNYKFFVLFLGYALLYCLFVAMTTLEYFIRFWRGELNGGMGRFHILFLFFVSLMFAISLVSLFGYHIYLTVMNRTTLEAFRAPIFRIGGPDKNGFNLGKSANFQEVFGDNWKLWFLPVYTSLGDGLQYPTRLQQFPQTQTGGNLSTNTYNSMGATVSRLATSPRSAGGNDVLIPINNELDSNNHENSMIPSPTSYSSNQNNNDDDDDINENASNVTINMSIVDNSNSTQQSRMSSRNDHIIDIHSLKTHNHI